MTKREKDRLQAVRQEMKSRSPSKTPPDVPVDLSYFSRTHHAVKSKLGSKIKNGSKSSIIPKMQHSGLLLSTVDRLNTSPCNGAISAEDSPNWSIQRMLQNVNGANQTVSDYLRKTSPDTKDFSKRQSSPVHVPSTNRNKTSPPSVQLFPASQTLQYLAKQPISPHINSPNKSGRHDNMNGGSHFVQSHHALAGTHFGIDGKLNGLSSSLESEYKMTNGTSLKGIGNKECTSPHNIDLQRSSFEHRQPEIKYSSVANSLDQHFAKSLASLYAKSKSTPPLPLSCLKSEKDGQNVPMSSATSVDLSSKSRGTNGMNGTSYTHQFQSMKAMWDVQNTTSLQSKHEKSDSNVTLNSSTSPNNMSREMSSNDSIHGNGIRELGITPEGAELVQEIVKAYQGNIDSQRNNLERILLAAIKSCMPETDESSPEKMVVCVSRKICWKEPCTILSNLWISVLLIIVLKLYPQFFTEKRFKT